MKIQTILTVFSFLMIFTACKKADIKKIDSRSFKMGFSTWSYGSELVDIDNNYELIKANGDIYSEQIDDNIPWNAWINGVPLPTDFVEQIDYRVSKITNEQQILLSISPLNTDRNDFIGDWDGSDAPEHTVMNNAIIEDAYVAHVLYLIDRFDPNYLVVSMESGDLLLSSTLKWNEFKIFMGNVRARVKAVYPTLKIAESVTLHNWYNPEIDDVAFFQEEMKKYVNEMDFAAISFYPFFAGQHKPSQFQKSFDFLHKNVSKPIAFVETTHLAENLSVSSYAINISSDETEQKEYVETLLANAYKRDYLFVIWWSFRDYDKLWETFPEEVKDIGKLWRDTGLQDENGTNRPAYGVWKEIFEK